MDAALNRNRGGPSAEECWLNILTFHFHPLLMGLAISEDITLDAAQDQHLLSKQAN